MFVAEGAAAALAADKQSIIEWLAAGDHFGALALYQEVRYVHCVQAEDFAIIRSLKRIDFQSVYARFPDLHAAFAERERLAT